MQVKIDTKEKFHVITPIDALLSATMTEGMEIALLPFLKNDISNVVFNMQHISGIDQEAAEKLARIQQDYYQHNASFVISNIQKEVEAFLAEIELLDLLNTAPTESEAGDIVQMEAIERELLDGEE